jgi:RimJ/RimL family protein N-acetyltransferase
MSTKLLHGSFTHLVAANAETDAEAFVRWRRDAEYLRLLDSGAARAWSLPRAKSELNDPPVDNWFLFMIRTLADDRLLGFVDLDVDTWAHGNGWVGIALGDRADWGQGYGTDAMRILLHFAFTEVNLQRVSLTVFGYNRRAIRSYEKTGFTVEGRVRQYLHRAGQWWDMAFMGILKDEWQARP